MNLCAAQQSGLNTIRRCLAAGNGSAQTKKKYFFFGLRKKSLNEENKLKCLEKLRQTKIIEKNKQ